MRARARRVYTFSFAPDVVVVLHIYKREPVFFHVPLERTLRAEIVISFFVHIERSFIVVNKLIVSYICEEVDLGK